MLLQYVLNLAAFSVRFYNSFWIWTIHFVVYIILLPIESLRLKSSYKSTIVDKALGK